MATVAPLKERHLAERPDCGAFLDRGRWISHAEFDLLCRRTAGWLAAQGIGPGDRVAVWLHNRIEWLALFFGLARLGAVLVAVNTRFRAAELEHVLERSGARMLVLQQEFAAVAQTVRAEQAPLLEGVAVVAPDARMPQRALGKPVIAFDAFERPRAPARDGAAPDAVAVLFTTSGTTQGPKLVMHTQRTIADHSLRVAEATGLCVAGARLLAALPLCGVAGFCSALAAYAAGAPVVLLETFDGETAAGLVRQHQVTHMFAIDEVYRRMLEGTPGRDPFPSARLFGFAAMQAGGTDFALGACARGVPFAGLYGSSEVQALFALQPQSLPAEDRIAAGGRPVAGAQAEVRIRDVDTGELLPCERSGEIEIRAPGNFVGYYRDPEATARAVRPDGYFRTGDVGYLRPDGTLVFETRGGDAVRLGGFLVNPAEIEDALKRLPGVADAQVVGVEIDGKPRCAAFVVPAFAGAASEEEVIAGCARMARFKVPARVWFVSEFPTTRSPNGTKVQRGRLRDMAMQLLSE